jgi:hypothetical protein
MKTSNKKVWLGLALLSAMLAMTPSIGGKYRPGSAMAAGQDYEDLAALFREFRELQKPKMKEGIPDYTRAAMREQRRSLRDLQRRLQSIDTSAWPIPQQVDHMLVRAEMNGLEFEHRVLRPWERDPAWYIVVNFQFGPKMFDPIRLPRLPASDDRIEALRTKLEAVPRILGQAKGNLKDPAADLVMLGIRSKQRESSMLSDFADLCNEHHPDLVPAVKEAQAAVDDFRAWLETRQDRWTGRAGIGKDNYDWYLRHVQLLPYTWETLMAVCEREYERAMAMMKLEEHKNRNLPPLTMTDSEAEYLRLFNQSQEFLLNFLKAEEVMTVPEYMTLNPRTRWTKPEVVDYFSHIQMRDPLPLMPHDFVGHGPDAVRHRGDTRPIRGTSRLYFIDGTRAEALATGMEEILMHLGMLDQKPRARELDYNLLAFRAARAISDLKLHSNEMTLREGFQFNIDMTPKAWLPEESSTMWHDIELYMRQPTYGVGYLIGSVQLQKLIADCGRQLGDRFVLKDFMDRFLDAGMIPLALIRWEMTGIDDEVRKLFR